MGATPSSKPHIHWFRCDLRLADNPALTVAAQGAPLLGLYILDQSGDWAPGGAQRWWLHHALERLGAALAARGGALILRRGPGAETLLRFASEVDAAGVFWNRLYDPAAIERDKAVKTALKADGRRAESFQADMLIEPWTLKTGTGRPYQVFTPFSRAARAALAPLDPPAPAPDRLDAPAQTPPSDRLDDWALPPTTPDWAGGLRATWTPGEAGAQARLKAFVDGPVGRYADQRDLPAVDGTSKLSPHLRWGELSPRQVWTAAAAKPGADKFLTELLWREFARTLLFHFPHLPETPLKTDFAAFPWREDETGLEAWRYGNTGYPIVDAGMRELYTTGWMHNRVRMIVGSFLIKHQLLHWRHGEDWFWDTLCDADLATNSASWQWVAGCGADAAPFFRIFNPVLQGEKFDPHGDYVRKWAPEVARLPNKAIHKPWTIDRTQIGAGYPRPIVDHKAARDRALAAFHSLKARAA